MVVLYEYIVSPVSLMPYVKRGILWLMLEGILGGSVNLHESRPSIFMYYDRNEGLYRDIHVLRNWGGLSFAAYYSAFRTRPHSESECNASWFVFHCL